MAAQVRRASEPWASSTWPATACRDAVVDGAFAASREFHALPLDEKLRLKLNENNIGYLPVNQSHPAGLHGPQGDAAQLQRELLHQPRARRRSPRRAGRPPLRGRNQWPEGHAAMRAAMVRYFKTLEGVGERMLPVLARALGMPAGSLRAVLRRRGPHQPALPALPAAGHRRRRAVRPGPAHRQLVHHDPGAHRGARAGGAAAVGGVAAPPLIPGTFLVNLGNMMKRWSNDRFLSTPHAVLNESGRTATRSRSSTARTSTRGDRVPAELHRARRSAALPARGLRRSGASSSTAPTTSTRRATSAESTRSRRVDT